MKRRTYDILFKKEVISYMEQGKSCYQAKKYFEEKNNECYDQSMFQQWYKIREKIKNCSSSMKRIGGAGRKTSLGALEEILLDEIINLRINKIKVTRTYISNRAILLAEENGISLNATSNWITGFMKRNGLSLRHATNFTTLSDETIILKAINYLKFLRSRLSLINISKTLLMDETAIYFEDTRTQTVDILGRKHVIMKSSGFSSMRITAIISIWADGRKALPLVIHKGKDGNIIMKQTNVCYTTQLKAWVNQDLIIMWIDLMFPLFDVSEGKCIVWDSCRAHISNKVKEHCKVRKIELIVIPGGMTPYLQAGDIGIFRELKDFLSNHINIWKFSNAVEYTKSGNPKPPTVKRVNSWVDESWKSVSGNNIKNSIASAGFSSKHTDWHISKHEIYGSMFNDAWIDDLTICGLQNIEICDNCEIENDIYDLCDE